MKQLGVLFLFSRWDSSELLETSAFLFDRFSVENSTHIHTSRWRKQNLRVKEYVSER